MNPFVESAKVVWENSQHVFVSDQAISDLACKMAADDLQAPAWREDVFPEDDDQFVEFIGVANAINFCFTDFATGEKFDVEYPIGSGQIKKGAFAMAASLRRAMDEGVPILNPKFLIALSMGEARRIFRCHTMAIPMLSERVCNLRNVGGVLSARAIKSFKQLFEVCGYRLFADGGLGILDVLPWRMFESYNDVSFWAGGRHLVRFQKRAQLLAAVYQGRALASGGKMPLLKDPEKIGPIVDYQVPRFLRFFGVLRYDSKLSEQIDGGRLIARDSVEEIEIRAQTVRAVAELLKRVNDLRKCDEQITMIELDYALWSQARNIPQKHHYTYTTAY